MLLLHGSTEIQERIKKYKAVQCVDEPEGISGSLWKSDKNTPRYFQTEPGTPLLLYVRTLLSVFNAPQAAIDLTAADRIAIIQQQGENTSQFVLQTREHPERMEQVVLTASSPTEAKRWVDALIMRREYFQKLLKIVPKTSLANNKAEVGRRLFSTLTAQHFDSQLYFSARLGPTEEIEEPLGIRYEKTIEYLRSNPPMHFNMWRKPEDVDMVQIRGYNYLNDHVKVPATRSLMNLVAVDCFKTGKETIHHVTCEYLTILLVNID